MRTQGTWKDLATIHNRIIDVRVLARRVLSEGVSGAEEIQIGHALYALDQARIAMDQALRMHPKWGTPTGTPKKVSA